VNVVVDDVCVFYVVVVFDVCVVVFVDVDVDV
jgi:hypothetical protein